MHQSLVWLRPKLMTAAEAVTDIPSGATIVCGGFGYAGVPFVLLEELHKAGPTDLTVAITSVSGEDFGIGPLAASKQLRKVLCCYMGESRVFADSFHRGEVEVELCPMGSLVDRINAGGTGISAFYTTTGYGTFLTQGRLPQRLAADGSGRVVKFTPARETRLIDGKWNVLETAIKADFALVKAWKADRSGNLIFRGSARSSNPAAARCGRVTIAEVEEIVECGELDPNEIHLSGVVIDRLVHVPNPPKPLENLVLRDATETTDQHDDSKHRMARRAALEVADGAVLNLGIGTPTLVAQYVSPSVNVLLMAGTGIIGVGGFPTAAEVDPDVINASKQAVTVDLRVGASFMDLNAIQGLIRGGYVTTAMLGTMEVAENGDLANWSVPGKRLSGMGGGMELVQSGCRVIILTNHVNKDGSPKILHRCRAPLTAEGVVDMIITELAVFQLVRRDSEDERRLLLTELAAGVTLEEVRAKTEADFTVSDDLRPMQQASLPPSSRS